MGIVKRGAQRKVARIEARRWRAVRHFLRPGEQPIDYLMTIAVYTDAELPGHLYLTNERVFWTINTLDGQEFYKDSFPLKMINGLGQDGNGMFWIDVRLPEHAPQREVLCVWRAAHELARHPVIIGTFLHKVEDACVALGTEPFTSAS